MTKQELQQLAKDNSGFVGAAPIYRRVYEAVFDMYGAEPYGCLVGAFCWDQTDDDCAVLELLADLGAVAHCPFISGAGAALVHGETWQRAVTRRDISNLFQLPEYGAGADFETTQIRGTWCSRCRECALSRRYPTTSSRTSISFRRQSRARSSTPRFSWARQSRRPSAARIMAVLGARARGSDRFHEP